VSEQAAAVAGEHVTVLVIGAGPAGLATAQALAREGVTDVEVIEREQSAGGVPRHCHHNGFGLRDLHRAMSGPRYAEELVGRALSAGVRIRTETMATGWAGPGVVALTSPAGIRTVTADAVVLATGARERPRAARLVPGDRGEGVFTTGQLQQWVHLQGLPVGRRALVVGAEHVSFSAVLTLRAAGVRTVAMVTDLARHQSYRGAATAARLGLRVPVWTDTDVTAIHGHERVRQVELHHRATGTSRAVDVDTVVFTGDWIPDNELARNAGLELDASSRSPTVDDTGACSIDRFFAAGNLVHPAETADIAALRGAAVGTRVAQRLATDPPQGRTAVSVAVAAPLQWCAPSRLTLSPHVGAIPVPHGLILRSAEFRRHPTVVVRQGGRQLARFRRREVSPHRSLRVSLDWSALVRPDAGEVRVSLE
jgi:thioredoxin reductase